ncbi:caspase domain-containing protein [Mycena latifolia]|nr:caspase domain-containing protein [Mycena latifolia]
MDGTSYGSYPEIFALIIGIDKYKAQDQFVPLKGAVNDATLFRRFLLDDLHVPRSHIKFLQNRDATRHTILSKFASHFLYNPDIPANGKSAMIFFFAGHGSRVELPGYRLTSDSHVEAICPFDERTWIGGNYVQTIPDYVLAQLVHQLSQRKGNNITVILDSCHSGGMARDAVNATVRSPAKASAFPLSQNGQIDAQNYNLWSPSAASHVLLAACAQGGSAYESSSPPFHGYFTNKLIPALRGALLQETTYNELIGNLTPFPVASQIPQCGGIHQTRLVFTLNHPLPGQRTFLLREMHIFVVAIERNVDVRAGQEYKVRLADHRPTCILVARMVIGDHAVLASQDGNPIHIPAGSYVVFDTKGGITPLAAESSYRAFLIQAGSFEGIRKGMDFPIRAPNGTMNGNLTAAIVGIGQSVLVSRGGRPMDIPMGSRAIVIEWKDKVRIHVPSNFTPRLFPLASGNVRRYGEAESYAAAEITLKRVHNDIVIKRRTQGPSIGYFRGSRFEVKKGMHLPSVIDGIAHFHYFLEHRPYSTQLSAFWLEMHRLEGESLISKPIGENIIKYDGMNVPRANITPHRHAKYGFTIRNTTNQDLFPYIFYFDCDDYTIEPWYTPEVAYCPPPLRQSSGQVTVGMGGETAFQFWLRKGQRSSTGFIKLFVSTEYLDIAWIKQKSPFKASFEAIGRPAGRETIRNPDWAELTVVVTMNDE